MSAGDDSDTQGYEHDAQGHERDTQAYQHEAPRSRAPDERRTPGAGSAARRAAASTSAVAASRGRRLVQRLGAPLILLIAVAVLFGLQNLTRVTISFWTVKVTSPLWIALYFWLIVGAVLGYLVARSAARRSRR
jgi:uncharacterized integral membrane protein